MQPWNFILTDDAGVMGRIHAAFSAANGEAAGLFEPERAALYRRMKLEGIRDAPLGLCATCDRDRAGTVVLGRTHQLDMDLYSTVCAVQNLWLAARAEGWVSIIHPDDLRAIPGIPETVVPVAYLCVGYMRCFHDKPELEKRGWARREDLSLLLFRNRWAASLV